MAIRSPATRVAAPDSGAGPPTDRWSIFRSRGFLRVFVAGVVSQTGDWVLIVGLPFYVYRTTGSTLATGTMFLAALLPQVVLGSLAGVFVDRWNRKRTVVAADLLLAAGLLPLLFVHGTGTIWIVYLVAVSESCVEQFFVPAEGALIPRLVREGELLAANSLYGGGRQAARLVGAAAGGVVAVWGIAGVAAVDAVSFLASAVVLSGVAASAGRVAERLEGATGAVSSSLHRFVRDWRDGMRIALASASARAILAFALITAIGEGVFLTLAAPFVIRVLSGSSVDYGALLSFQAIGGITGGLVIASVGRRWKPSRLLPLSAVIFGGLDLALFNYPLFAPILLPALVLIVVIGFPAAAVTAAYTALQQAAVSDTYRGRFLGALSASASLAAAGGIALAGLLADRIGIIPVLEIQGVGYVLAGLWMVRALGNRVSGPGARGASEESESSGAARATG